MIQTLQVVQDRVDEMAALIAGEEDEEAVAEAQTKSQAVGGSIKSWGYPPKWLVDVMENPIEIDDRGFTTLKIPLTNMVIVENLVKMDGLFSGKFH